MYYTWLQFSIYSATMVTTCPTACANMSCSRLLVLAILAEVGAIIVTITLWHKNSSVPVLTTEPERDSFSWGSNLKYGGSQERGLDFEASTWKKKTFCHDLLVNTFHEDIPVCHGGAEIASGDQVRCYGNVHAAMVLCVYENLLLTPRLAREVASSDTNWNEPRKGSFNLLKNTSLDCMHPSTENLRRKTNSKDFESRLTQYILGEEKVPVSVCDVWINKTTFFHVSNAVHVYFRFLDLYNVHKALLDFGETEGNYQVMRIGNLKASYLFPEFDKALFPGSLTLDSLQTNGTVCFKKVVFVPTSYKSLPFRCKMNRLLRQQCFECSGKGLSGSPFSSFRSRVLRACGIIETDYCSNEKPFNLLVVSRKPYKRWASDRTPSFKRVLQNEADMVDRIQRVFPNITLKVVHMEDLAICEQVRSAVEADVMLGVHGAGLVHFWWLRDEATAIELEPSFETGNPSFRMLTTLAGRKYAAEMVGGVSTTVSVNVQQLIQKLEQIILPWQLKQRQG